MAQRNLGSRPVAVGNQMPYISSIHEPRGYNDGMAHVLILAGGTSDEREISLRSGQAVAAALQAAGHKAEVADPAQGLAAIIPQLQVADVVFPALHGKGGEDGTVQRELERLHVAFVGSGSEASALCFDKWHYSQFLLEHDISAPVTAYVTLAEFQASRLRTAPFVLKPNDGGSSIDTFIVRDPLQTDISAIQEAFGRHERMILQELISGHEITVAVLDKQPLPVIEIIPPTGGEFDFINKYNGATQELCPPVHVAVPSQQQAQTLALHIHQLTECRDLSRTDMIVADGGKLVVLETNTIPGLTDQSLLPKAARAAGWDMVSLVDALVQAARQRHTATDAETAAV